MRIHRFKDRLRSETGASIVIALLFFAMCAMVGSVVLTAASAAAGRNRKLAGDAKEEYAVESAAKLVGELLDGYTFSGRHPLQKDISPDDIQDVNRTDIENVLSPRTDYPLEEGIRDLILKQYCVDWIEQYNDYMDRPDLTTFPRLLSHSPETEGKQAPLDSFSVTIAVEDGSDTETVKNVQADIGLYDGFVILAEFSVTDGSRKMRLQFDTIVSCDIGKPIENNDGDEESEETETEESVETEECGFVTLSLVNKRLFTSVKRMNSMTVPSASDRDDRFTFSGSD